MMGGLILTAIVLLVGLIVGCPLGNWMADGLDSGPGPWSPRWFWRRVERWRSR